MQHCTETNNFYQGGIILDTQMNTHTFYATLLNQCDRELDGIYHTYAARYDLSDAALWILYILHDAPAPLTQADIGNYWFLSRQTIHTALHTLRSQQLITLAPIPGNRKSKQILFTQQGYALATQVILPLKQAEARVFDSFSPEENQQFISTFQKRSALLRQFLENKP